MGSSGFPPVPGGETGLPPQKKLSTSVTSHPPATSVFAHAQESLLLSNPVRRQAAMQLVIQGMTASDAPQIERLFAELDRKGIMFEEADFASFIVRWGELNALGAMEHLEKTRGSTATEGEKDWNLRHLLKGWAASDPQAALAWINSQPDSPAARSSLPHVINGMAAQNLAQATDFVLDQFSKSHPLVGRNALASLADAAVRANGLAGLTEWFDSLPADATGPENARARAADIVGKLMSHASFEEGARWAAAQADKPWRSNSAIQEVVREWGPRDPATVTKWAASIPAQGDPEVAYAGVSQSVQSWVEKAPDDVAAWLTENKNEPFYDYAAAGIARYYRRHEDLETSEKWVESIRSDEVRAQVFRHSGFKPE